jgi:transglutaminase-like putative cysteine protease
MRCAMNDKKSLFLPLFPRWLRHLLDVLMILVIVGQVFAVVPEPENAYITKYPNANSVIVFDSTWTTIQPDGRYKTTDHYRIALISEKGVKAHSQDATGYFLEYDTAYVNEAYVITPDGIIIPVSEDAIKDVPLPAFAKFFMENVREKIITFPGLEVGSSVDVSVTSEMRNPPIKSQYNTTEAFQYYVPVEDKYYEIRAPKDMPLRWTVLDGEVSSHESVVGDERIFTWSAQNMDQIIPEANMPPASEVQTRLLVSTMPDWQFFSKWYYDLSLPSYEPDETVKTAVAQVIEGIQNRDDQMRALYYYVAQNIRYVETALTGAEAGYKPEPAAVTLRNRYGVCRDKAALLVAMYREVGLPAEMVLINASARADKQLPVDQFNHAIVAVPKADGSWMYMDPTLEKASDYIAAFEQDKPALICTSTGEDLQPIPMSPPDANTFHVSAKSKLSKDGRYISQVTFATSGMFDLIIRSWLGSVPPARRQMVFQQLAQTISPDAAIENFGMSNLTDLYTPVTITMTLDIPDYSMQAGKYLLFKMPLQGTELDFLSNFMLRGADVPDRKYPLELMATFEVISEEIVDLPDGWRVKSLPENIAVTGKGFQFDASSSAKGSQVALDKKMTFGTLDIPIADIPEVQHMLKNRSIIDRGRVFLLKE